MPTKLGTWHVLLGAAHDKIMSTIKLRGEGYKNVVQCYPFASFVKTAAVN